MGIRLSRHAIDQIVGRGITSPDEVEGVIEKVEPLISQRKDEQEIRVLIKQISFTMAADGSNGDCVVACVDPKTKKVSTVMLQRAEQIKRQRKYVPYIVKKGAL